MTFTELLILSVLFMTLVDLVLLMVLLKEKIDRMDKPAPMKSDESVFFKRELEYIKGKFEKAEYQPVPSLQVDAASLRSRRIIPITHQQSPLAMEEHGKLIRKRLRAYARHIKKPYKSSPKKRRKP